MLAHHPTTGKPIRILRTGAQLYESHKTMIWVRASMNGSRWNRWTTLITEPGAAKLCTPDVIVIPPNDSFDDWKSVLQTYCTDASPVLVCVSSEWCAVADKHGISYDRMFSRDELYDMYPYLGEPLKEADSIEKCILAFAHILRTRYIVWTSSNVREELDFGAAAMYDAWKKTLQGELKHISEDSSDSIIPRMWLIQQYFKPSNSRRLREIQQCLQKNLECPLIDHILLLNESEYSDLPAHSKLQTSIIGRRMTYLDVMKAICERVPAGEYVVFANSDIYFDASLKYCWRVGMAEKSICMALLRWEDSTGELFGPRADSQDAWIVARDTIARMTITEDDFGFPFGKSGCDNALALIMMQKRCFVVNPAHSIKTWHIHTSNYRTYDPKDILYRTHYLYLDPTFIQTYEIVRDMSAAKYGAPKDISMEFSNRRTSFPRRILGVDDTGVQTICSMLHRQSEGVLNFSPHSANMWSDVTHNEPLYHIQGGAFMTYNGLINTWNELLVGKHEEWARGWETAHQSNIMPSIHVPNLIALNLTNDAMHSLSTWCLLYLSRAIAIRNAVRNGSHGGIDEPEFLVPSIPGINEFLHDCKWGDTAGTRITIVPVLENMNYYSEHIWAVPPPANIPKEVHLTTEDIARLRSLKPSTPKREKGALPVAVFCVEKGDDGILSRSWCEQVVEYVLQKKWDVRYVDESTSATERRIALSHASWIFGRGSALEWMWYAAPGTTVMEFMSDSHPNASNIHLAGAAGLRYIVGVIKNEPADYQRQHALEDVNKAIQTYGFKEMLTIRRAKHGIEIPRILLPAGDALNGIWAHSGDTFREMAEIWAERGYVTIERNETSGYCWWGGVGEILLYDRPTPRWWNDKQSYQLALFGNCAPPNPDNGCQSVWSFWPRSPRSIEVVNMLGLNMLSYDSRTIKSIFLGKVENGVQHAHRTGADWKTAVELFSMPIDPTGAPYPFTQEQYLEKLCNSRFGLCLPGYGPKCNREIEYFACGVVPIVTPGVDMKGYLIPPIEGMHYFTARTPEEVRAIVEKTKPEQWLRMSIAGRKWWNACASAEGLFRLTWERIEQCKPFLTTGVIPKHLIPQF
jgi:hypothetical protein